MDFVIIDSLDRGWTVNNADSTQEALDRFLKRHTDITPVQIVKIAAAEYDHPIYNYVYPVSRKYVVDTSRSMF